MKRDFEDRARRFDAREWWRNSVASLTSMAANDTKSTASKKAVTLYNPYEGLPDSRQLSETVEEFLQRLPPRSTHTSEMITWIRIANPYRKAPALESNQKINAEGPPEEGSGWAQFVVLGGNMLDELTTIRHDIEKQKSGKAKATITKAYNPLKNVIVQKLLDTAADLHCTSGKVMIQPTHYLWQIY